MTEPTLIERLEETERSYAEMKNELCGFPKDGKIQSIQEAIAALKERDWVKIDDPIVETWKDGREVDILLESGTRINDCQYKSKSIEGFSNWGTWNYRIKENEPTHIRLPPQPPKG